jgi:Zn-dependent protease
MKSEYRIGSVWGIPINLHISLLLLMGFLALRGGLNGIDKGGLLGGVFSVVFVLVFEALVFTSIALHELGHSFVAIHKGCRVREITLMFIGGAAKMDQMPRRPFDEFLMAAAGPAVSIVLGTAAIATSLFLPPASGWLLKLLNPLLFAIGIVNLMLAGFNLLPAFPMDGGRIFRALLTPKLGRLHATRLAAKVGKVIAVILALIGLFGFPGIPFLETRNLFMVFIAGFVFIYGEREYRMVQVEELMRQRGFGNTPPPFSAGEDESTSPDDDTVLISPPPYSKGPAERTEIHRATPARDNPFRDLFG